MQEFKNRNLLVIAYYFPPMGLSGVQRILKFVKYLPEYGWNPIVLTTNSSAYFAFDSTLLEDLQNKEIIIYRTEKDAFNFLSNRKKKQETNKQKTLSYPSSFYQKIRRIVLQTLFQPDSRILWKKHALKTGHEIFRNHKIDAILATAPPFTDFLIGHELAKEYKIPLILDYRDLWVDNAYYYFTTPFHKIYSINKEREILDFAHKVIVTSEKMRHLLLNRYRSLAYHDIELIPHGFDREDFEIDLNKKQNELNAFRKLEITEDENNNESDKLQYRIPLKNSKVFTICHSGLFPDDLTPKYFLQALAKFLNTNPNARANIEMRFVGVMKKNHLRLIQKYKLSDVVKVVGYVSHLESIAELKNADLLWMMVPNDIVTPSRIYEYVASGKAMLINAPNGHLAKTALDSKLAKVCPVKDVKATSEALQEWYALWQRKDMPKANPEYIKKFDRKTLTSQLAKIIGVSVGSARI